MRRRSTPASSRCVANVCRNKCGYTALVIWAARPALGANMGHTSGGDGFSHAGARKEPGVELIEFPVAPQQGEEVRGEHHHAIALAFALAHLDDHALGVNVGALQRTEFGDPQASGLEGGQDRAMLEVAWRQQQRCDLLTTEDDGEGFGLLGVRDVVDHPRAT